MSHDLRRFIALGCALALVCTTPASASLFSTDFEDAGLPVGVSGGALVDAQGFSGSNFGDQFLWMDVQNGTVALTLSGVAAGTIDINFDLVLIDSWDGDQNDVDPFIVEVDDVEVFNRTFTNNAGNTQSFPVAGSATAAGAFVSGSDLYEDTAPGGVTAFNDSAYALSLTGVAVSGGTVVIEFFGSGLQDLDNESWAIDNLNVVPEPGSAALLALCGLAGLRRRR